MISIIICSIDSEKRVAVEKNINQTIGVPYELIILDNSILKKGICEIYNMGAARAHFDILCFMHEDVELKTFEWGKSVLNTFDSDPGIGVLGVAGSGYKSLTPMGWYCVEFEGPYRSFQNILQGFKSVEKEDIHAYHNPVDSQLNEVICVDGVWFCARKEVVQRFSFDEKLLRGFHGYDLDFCLSVYGHHKIMVTYDVLMRHESEGSFDKKWLSEILKVHRKWSKSLPITNSDASEKEIYYTEKRAVKNLVEKMISWKFSFMDIHKMLYAFASSRKVPLKLFFKGYVHLIENWRSLR